ncbi:hypothetical protein C5B42_04570, partial [Candidatus Cerribacteria bacterium 'Amazon FNV 2010 28 9']
LALSMQPPEVPSLKGETREEARERKRKEDELSVATLGLEEDIHSLSRKTLLENIMFPRMKEMFEMVGTELEKQKLFSLVPAGIVITGGGAQTAGIAEVCKRTLSMSTRIGIPTGVRGLVDEIEIPSYATAIGLLLYGAKEGGEEVRTGEGGNLLKIFSSFSGKGSGILNKIQSLLKSLLP